MNLQMELKNFLDDKGRLKVYPSKRKMKMLALVYLASKFEEGVILNRTHDCKEYWKEEQQPIL